MCLTVRFTSVSPIGCPFEARILPTKATASHEVTNIVSVLTISRAARGAQAAGLTDQRERARSTTH